MRNDVNDADSALASGDLAVQWRQSIQASWVRSRTYGIDPQHVRRQERDHAPLAPFQNRARVLLEAADPVVRLVNSVLRDEAHMVAISDADGVVVRFVASRAAPEATNFFEGASWHERDIGTNGIGTALAASAPVLVVGREHFVHDYHRWACVGVPLRSPEGEVLGALDLSVPNERMSVHTWGWALSLVGSIEAELRRAAEARSDDIDTIESVEDPEELRATVRELVEDRRRLEDWDRRKDGALATVSHELSNPLQAMALSVHLLGAARENPQRFDGVSERLRHQVKRLSKVVDDVRDVARVKRGGLSIQKQIVDLNVVLDHAADAVQPQIDERQHTLVRRFAPRPLIVDGDPDRLEQVFANILSNAAKYTPPGGNVVVDSQAAGGVARIRVCDDGDGISPEDLSSVFGEFTRVVRTNNDPGGLGIGLALVKSIVLLHGGSVIARSDGPGKGSEFEVALPLANGSS